MASSMVSPIFNTFAGASEFYTQEKCGTIMLKGVRYGELLAAVLHELTTLYKGTQTKTDTPSKVFGQYVLEAFTRLGLDKLCVKCDALQEFESEEFGFSLRSQFGKLTHRKKGEFDPSYDIHFKEMELPLEETRLFTLIKALRLYVAELFIRMVGSYDPADFDSSRVTYNVGTAKRSSQAFIAYAEQLNQIHFGFCKYSETLSEFSETFKKAAELSKALSEKQKAERESKRRVEKTDAKAEKKTDTKVKVVVKSTQAPRVFKKAEDGKVVQLPPPPPSVWKQREADQKEKQEAQAAQAAAADAESESEDEEPEPSPAVEAAAQPEEGFKVVVSKRGKKPQESQQTSTKGRRFIKKN
jgi:hypothetical protein